MFRQVAQGTHPDLRVIEAERDPRTGRLRSEITVDVVRAATAALRVTAAAGGCRVAVIDGAETLNRNAANALLKTLEEPPEQAFLILVSHRPASLPATIRSRCAKLRLQPLPDDVVADALARLAPELGPSSATRSRCWRAAASDARSRSPRTASSTLPAACRGWPQSRSIAWSWTSCRASWRAPRIAADRGNADLAPGVAGARDRSGLGRLPLFPVETSVLAKLAARRPLDRWATLWEKVARLAAAVEALNLERSHALMQMLTLLAPDADHADRAPAAAHSEPTMPAADAFYVTTPIYYVNDAPHIGHAYTTLACDTIARFARLEGRRVRFLTGTDEHGQKVEKAAAAAGKAPQAFTDEVSQRFRDLARRMQITNDDFIRTTEARHRIGVQALARARRARPDLSRHLCRLVFGARRVVLRRERAGRWPGADRRPRGVGRGAELFFRLSAWQQPLLDFYEAHPDFILPASRRNEVVSFVRRGLQDLSVSRTSFAWGVPVPDDPDHVVYVWLDALTNYMTALGYPDCDSEDYRTFWPADVHVVGKDILRFHAVFWPAFLLAAGLEPPKRVFAHGWWTNEGQKISKSLGNVIDPSS